MAKLVKCKSCGNQVNKSANTCPSCGVSNPGTTWKDIFGGLAVLVILGFILIKGCSSDPKTPEELALEKAQKAEQTCRSETMAYVMSQTFVKRHLKSPSTAEFPWMTDDNVSVSYLGDCTSLVVSYVDSQNGFGAMIRSKYAVKLKYNPDTDNYTLIDIGID